GSANTNHEAMGAGLPVITTLNAGSIVRDGVDGFIVPIRDPDAIKERLLLLYENREMGRAMGKSGRDRVAVSSWETYENRLITIYGDLIGRNAGT
ncbi:MAG: glycosyltransferase, partial [Candidatus Deferrimicrobiaceae bacterium]